MDQDFLCDIAFQLRLSRAMAAHREKIFQLVSHADHHSKNFYNFDYSGDAKRN
jgi:hypothetical protein